MRRLIFLMPALAALAGCPVTQPQGTPVEALRVAEPATGCHYWLYVPSYYDGLRSWPMVLTLHGTHGWDSGEKQVREWKYLAEKHGFLVAAPDLRSVQGILPVVESWWRSDLEDDERRVLAVLDDVVERYNVDPRAVLLTGFSAGGYPLYYVGLRNPRRFGMLIGRSCNSSTRTLREIEITDETRSMPMTVLWGKDEPAAVVDDSWAAFRFLREQGCRQAQRMEVRGGHLRRPELAYKCWAKHLPPEYRR